MPRLPKGSGSAPAGHSPAALPGQSKLFDAAAPRAVTSIYQVTTIFTQANIGYFANVMHYQPNIDSGAQVSKILSALANAFIIAMKTELVDALANDCMFAQVQTRRLTGGSPTFSVAVQQAGIQTTPCNNTAVAANIELIPIEAPWQAGHLYFSGIPEGGFESNTFLGPYFATLKTLADKFVAGFNTTVGTETDEWVPVIYDRAGGIGRLIDTADVKSKPAVLSRRLRPWTG